MKRKNQYLFSAILFALFLQGCAGIFYSSLTQDDIRATAYHRATTQLATTIEVIFVSTSAVGDDAPIATFDPTYCPEDELDKWKDFALGIVQELDQDLQLLLPENYTTEQIEEMVARSEILADSIGQTPFPRCADKTVRKLINVENQFVTTLQTVLDQNPATYPIERAKLLDTMAKLFKELRELFADKDFKDFEIILEKYETL